MSNKRSKQDQEKVLVLGHFRLPLPSDFVDPKNVDWGMIGRQVDNMPLEEQRRIKAWLHYRLVQQDCAAETERASSTHT